jgi:RHS repeat-associated protein
VGPVVDAESGLQYLRARYYDPATAQFLTKDPLVAITQEPYGYVGGNPLNYVDPTGLCSASNVSFTSSGSPAEDDWELQAVSACPGWVQDAASYFGYGDFGRWAYYYSISPGKPDAGTKAKKSLLSAIGWTGFTTGLSHGIGGVLKGLGKGGGKVVSKTFVIGAVAATAIDGLCMVIHSYRDPDQYAP